MQEVQIQPTYKWTMPWIKLSPPQPLMLLRETCCPNRTITQFQQFQFFPTSNPNPCPIPPNIEPALLYYKAVQQKAQVQNI